MLTLFQKTRYLYLVGWEYVQGKEMSEAMIRGGRKTMKDRIIRYPQVPADDVDEDVSLGHVCL